MDTIFNQVCVLVTAAFALTLVPGFRQRERSLLSMRDQGTALIVFLLLGLVEEAAVSHVDRSSERIVAVCAAGLVAGPRVGLAVGVFVTWLAVAYDGLPFGSIAISMIFGGLAGGWLYRWRPKLAQQPITGLRAGVRRRVLEADYFERVTRAGARPASCCASRFRCRCSIRTFREH